MHHEPRSRDASTDTAEQAPVHRPVRAEIMPDILEVFGAEPLVKDEDGERQEASAQDGEGEQPASSSAGDDIPRDGVAMHQSTSESRPARPVIKGLRFDAPIAESPEERKELASSRTEASSPQDADGTPAPATPSPQEQPQQQAKGHGVPSSASTQADDARQREARDGDLEGRGGRHLESVLSGVYQALHTGQDQMAELLRANATSLASLADGLAALTKQQSFLPPKLRALGQRLDTLTTSIADDRCRALLIDMLGLFDLVSAGLAAVPEPGNPRTPTATARRFLTALHTRIEQILEGNGVSEVPAEGQAFDPTLHHAVEAVPVFTEEENGRISTVFRRGFRTERTVLRYADVAVGLLGGRRKGEGDEEEQEGDPQGPSADLAPARGEAADGDGQEPDGDDADADSRTG